MQSSVYRRVSWVSFFLLVLTTIQTFQILHFPAWAAEPSGRTVAPEKSLGWLTNGNTRFTKGYLRRDGQSSKDVKKLVKGQAPHAIVLSCSDSRVPPELVFDQKLGEIFTVRTAGMALDDNAIGSIEYAVEHLGARLIVVMGHTSCGAVATAHGTMEGASAGSHSLDNLVKDIHPRLKDFKGKAPSPGLEAESWANAEGVAKDIVIRSKILAERFEKGEVWVVPSLYHLASGKVEFHERLKMKSQ
ncbi:MAG: carbonic anhydrase [Bdellovibrionales bacterium]